MFEVGEESIVLFLAFVTRILHLELKEFAVKGKTDTFAAVYEDRISS